MKSEKGDYFKKFESSGKKKNPLGTHKVETEVIPKEVEEEFPSPVEGLDLVSGIRKERSEETIETRGPIGPESKEKQERMEELNKEVEALLEKAKLDEEPIEWSKLAYPTATQFYIYKDDQRICTVTIGWNGLFMKTKQDEEKFLHTQKRDFMKKFKTFCGV